MMSDINTNSALSGLISQYGTDEAKAKNGITSTTSTESSEGIGNQDVFLQLYIEQLKNQDPTQPQETGDMVSQMAEFSSLERLTSMASEMSNMTEALMSNQALTASTLVGKSVFAPQSSATITEGSAVQIRTSFPDDALTNKLEVTDSAGQTVKTIDLLKEEFAWDGTNDAGEAVPSGEYNFKVTSRNADGEVTELDTELPARINSVTINGEQGTTLNVQGVGSLKLSSELEIIG